MGKNKKQKSPFNYTLSSKVTSCSEWHHFEKGEDVNINISNFDNCRIIVLKKVDNGIEAIIFDADTLNTTLEYNDK